MKRNNYRIKGILLYVICLIFAEWVHAQTTTQDWATLASSASPYGIAIDASGNIYTANYGNNTISKITSSGTVTQAWATLASGTYPYHLAIDASGNIYTSNSGNRTVSKITSSGGITQNWATLPGVVTGFFSLSIDGSGSVYTANYPNTVSKITAGGDLTGTFATLTTNGRPRAIAIDASGNLYVINRSVNTISKITPSGSVTVAWATLASGATPTGIVIDASGNLYTANYGNSTVSKITAAGAVTQAWATLPADAGTFRLAIDSVGNIYTANYDNNTVSKITAAGVVIPAWASLASDAFPWDIAVDARNNVYTVNSDNNTVSKICNDPTLDTVTAAPVCPGNFTYVVLSGLQPNTTATATYKIGASNTLYTQQGTADANGAFSFPTNTLGMGANGIVIEITKITNASGCTTEFTDKKVALVVGMPTLSTVTAAPTCSGNFTNIVLSGLQPNTTATATYKIGSSNTLYTQQGTSSATGTFSFPTNILSLAQNGITIEITKIKNVITGCETNFTGKTVTLVVYPSPTLSTVTAQSACSGTYTNVVLSGLLPNTEAIATYKIGNSNTLYTQQGTSSATGTFSFPTENLSVDQNGILLEITKIVNVASGCETNFTGKTVTLVVNPSPTLSTVTAAPACSGTYTNVVLSGLLADTEAIATYKIGNSNTLYTQQGTSSATGTFSFPTNILSLAQNGITIEITKIKNVITNCETNFTGKIVTLVVNPVPTLSTVSTEPVCSFQRAVVTLTGLLPNTTQIVFFTKGNSPIPRFRYFTTDAEGTYNVDLGLVTSLSNGTIINFYTIYNVDNGCTTEFTNKSVALVVNRCRNLFKEAKEEHSKEEAIAGELSFNVVTLYPNPTSEVLNIDSAIEIKSVEILNMQGQRMLTASQKQINVSSLPTGTYMVRIQDVKNNLTTKRVIKN